MRKYGTLYSAIIPYLTFTRNYIYNKRRDLNLFIYFLKKKLRI